MKPHFPTAIAIAALLAACGAPSEGENAQAVYDNTADALEEGAAESAPEARPILENAADDLRDRGENVQEAIDDDPDLDEEAETDEES